MAQEPNNPPRPVRRWHTDTVFHVLDEPFRQQILRLLAYGGWKTSVDLNAASGRTRFSYLQHLRVLSEAGFIVQKKNPKDRRQTLYSLHPDVAVAKTDEALTIDFGCCMLRFQKDF